MRRSIHLALILCLMLTGIGLGAARGTILLAGQVAICTGEGIVLIDHPAGPARAHVCPDMALSFLAATAHPATCTCPARVATAADPPMAAAGAQGRESPRPVARGPPSRQLSPAKPV